MKGTELLDTGGVGVGPDPPGCLLSRGIPSASLWLLPAPASAGGSACVLACPALGWVLSSEGEDTRAPQNETTLVASHPHSVATLQAVAAAALRAVGSAAAAAQQVGTPTFEPPPPPPPPPPVPLRPPPTSTTTTTATTTVTDSSGMRTAVQVDCYYDYYYYCPPPRALPPIRPALASL